MAWRRASVLLPLASLLARAAAEPGATTSASFTEIHMAEDRVNATLALRVQNRAATKVRLMNCGASHEVEAGAEVTLKLEGLGGFWVVPEAVAWDCYAGPFDLFYVAANLSGPELLAGVGYGMAPDGEDDGDAAAPAAGNSSSELREAAEGAAGVEEAPGGIVGVELAMGTSGAEVSAVGCRGGACSEGLELPGVPERLDLVVLGPQLSMLSRWRGWRRRVWRRGFYGRWGRRGWYGGWHRRYHYGWRRGWYWGPRPGRCYWWCHGCCWC